MSIGISFYYYFDIQLYDFSSGISLSAGRNINVDPSTIYCQGIYIISPTSVILIYNKGNALN